MMRTLHRAPRPGRGGGQTLRPPGLTLTPSCARATSAPCNICRSAGATAAYGPAYASFALSAGLIVGRNHQPSDVPARASGRPASPCDAYATTCTIRGGARAREGTGSGRPGYTRTDQTYQSTVSATWRLLTGCAAAGRTHLARRCGHFARRTFFSNARGDRVHGSERCRSGEGARHSRPRAWPPTRDGETQPASKAILGHVQLSAAPPYPAACARAGLVTRRVTPRDPRERAGQETRA